MNVTEYDSVSREEVSHVNFKWTIENFSSCLKTPHSSYEQPYCSSTFNLGGTASKWQLATNKSGWDCRFFLRSLDTIALGKRIESQLSFFASGVSYLMECRKDSVVHGTTPVIHLASISSQDIESKNLLVNDTLSVLFKFKVTEFVNSTSVRKKKDPVSTSDNYEGLEQLFGSLLHSYVTFVADGKEFHTHKVLVAVKSPVLDAMFKKKMKEQHTNRIEVQEGAQVFEELFHFIHTGRARNLQSFAQDLLIAADKYQIGELKDLCEKELIRQLNETNATRLLLLADLHNAERLKDEASVFINVNFPSISRTVGWKAMATHYKELIYVCFSRRANI